MRRYKMNCEETNRLLEEAFGRERDTSRQLELEEHLSHCSACRSVAREWQEFRSFFRAAAPRYKAPSQLRAKVLAAMQLEKAKRDFPRSTQPWVYAAAVLVSVLVSGPYPSLSRQCERAFQLGSVGSFPIDSRRSPGRCCLWRPARCKTLVRGETRLFSSAGRSSLFGVRSPGRQGVGDSKSPRSGRRLQA